MSRLGPATLIVLIVAILLGMVGAYGVRQYLRVPPAPKVVSVVEVPKPKKYRVPFALVDLPAHRKVVISDITSIELTREEVAKRKLPTDASLDFRYVIGRVLKEPVPAKGPFPISKFYPAGVEPNLADLLKPGQRAVTVPIRAVDAAGGFATPGSLVDVVFRSKPTEVKDLIVPEVTLTLLQNVLVLALGNSSFPGMPPKGAANSVTVAVTPDQAQMLQVVEGKGELSLAMRAPGVAPEAPMVPDRLTLEKLLGLSRTVVAPAFTAEIYRGGNKQTVTFIRPPGAVVVPAVPTLPR